VEAGDAGEMTVVKGRGTGAGGRWWGQRRGVGKGVERSRRNGSQRSRRHGSWKKE